ncbi:hypothetical protein JW707_03850 [Candidatus Woesearchaeota archaeon]|nr:hypothetical protein [Candidatus Woesearchaeota archaeon]
MKRIIVCLLAVLLLAGCAQQAAETAPEQKTETKATVTEEVKTDEVKPVSTILSSEIVDSLNSQLKPGVKYTDITPNHAVLEYGNQFIFGLGLQNIQNAEDTFLIKVTFDKAYDKYTNTISVSEEMVNSWLKTNLEEFTLAPGEKKIVSVLIEVGNANTGTKPQPGTYEFDVETLHQGGGYRPTKEYVGRREVSIRVEQ